MVKARTQNRSVPQWPVRRGSAMANRPWVEILAHRRSPAAPESRPLLTACRDGYVGAVEHLPAGIGMPGARTPPQAARKGVADTRGADAPAHLHLPIAERGRLAGRSRASNRRKGSPLNRSRGARTARCCGRGSRLHQDLVVTPRKWRARTAVMRGHWPFDAHQLGRSGKYGRAPRRRAQFRRGAPVSGPRCLVPGAGRR